MGVLGCVRVYVGVRGYAQVCMDTYARMCAGVRDEFSEFLSENRVPTSADFNTYPIRIFLTLFLSSFLPFLY